MMAPRVRVARDSLWSDARHTDCLNRSVVSPGFIVQAVLTEPIVTDYTPAVKPPWAVLAFTFCLLALVMPREVLPEFCVASVAVAVCGWLVNWWCGRTPERTADEAHSHAEAG
jgi:hypothetical protein